MTNPAMAKSFSRVASHDPAVAEIALQKLVTVFVATGLAFLLLPGTFLGVWNLVSISGRHSLAALSPAWLQAHGHAQIFGWIGTFIIGIGFYSLTKMAGLKPFSIGRGWLSWALWTVGLSLRWMANVTEWNWRILLPLSAALQLAAFLIFFVTVSGHKAKPDAATRHGIATWMKLVIASTIAFLFVLLVNLGVSLMLARGSASPAVAHWLNQRFIFLAAWGFPVMAVWGFNARWLPVFLGLRDPSSAGLMSALACCSSGIVLALAGRIHAASLLLLAASVLASLALGVFERSRKSAKTTGVSESFPHFVRLAYVWLLVAAALGVYAAAADSYGGVWGASRHALTVGFLATMVFAIGQRVLPAFCGMRVLFSRRLMFASLAILNVGCALRVGSEIPAYEANLPVAWSVLPVSAITELTAVMIFALNIGITLLLPPPQPAAVRLTA